jgi:hypothetical protein
LPARQRSATGKTGVRNGVAGIHPIYTGADARQFDAAREKARLATLHLLPTARKISEPSAAKASNRSEISQNSLVRPLRVTDASRYWIFASRVTWASFNPFRAIAISGACSGAEDLFGHRQTREMLPYGRKSECAPEREQAALKVTRR